MPITYKTKGVILKHKDYKEADRLYTIYTQNQGKLILRAQGVKKINSKLAGHLEVFNQCNLFIAQGRVFSRIGGAQIISSYKNIKTDLEKLKIVKDALNIFDKLITEPQKDEKIYHLLINFLDWSHNNKINDLIKQSFIFKLLDILGYQKDFSDYSGDLAKVLFFLIQNKWHNIQKLRLDNTLWQQLSLVYSNSLNNHLN